MAQCGYKAVVRLPQDPNRYETGELMEAPILTGELELTAPIIPIALPKRPDGVRYNGAYLLVRLQHVPVGYAFLRPDALDPAGIAQQVWDQVSDRVNAYYTRAGLSAVDRLPECGLPVLVAGFDPTDRPPVSVVVCSRNRPDRILIVLKSLALMHYRPLEIIVVDNAPSSEAMKEAVLAATRDDQRIRYVREPRPGLSRARNRGLAEASGEIVAFTDDDTTVDPWWLDGIVHGFRAAPNVACVTGLIATAQLENSAQLYFHLREAWGVARERRVFDLTQNRDDSRIYPYSPGIFGAGANFAVTGALMKEISGFNEALGAGTLSGGGEDLELFMRIILSGHRIVYEPSAVVFHFHRDDPTELADQMLRYGSGCTAALTAILMRVPRARRELPLRIVFGMLRVLSLNARVRGNPTLPKGLISKEFRGLLIGPMLYLKSRRQLNHRRET